MRYAHIADGVVQNVSIWADVAPATDEQGRVLVACGDAGIGWSYDGSTFSPPAFEPDPTDTPGIL